MSEWRDTTLGDVLTLQRGFDITKKQQRDGNVPVVSSSGVASYHDEARVNGPGVVIGRKGSLGTVFYIEGPFWPHDTTLWVKDFKGNDPYYCHLLLRTLPLAELDAGSSNPTLNRNHAHTLPVRAPTPPVQRRIAAVLAAIDRLIAINERRINLLDHVACSLYREWFVRFRFPAPGGLEFRSSTIGPIPSEWSVSTIAELVGGERGAISSGPFGSRLGRKDYVASGVPVIRGTNLAIGGRFIDDGFVFVSNGKADTLRTSIAYPGDLVITQRGTLGQVGLVPSSPRFPRYVISQSQMKITADPDVTQYLYAFLRSADGAHRILSMAITAGVPHINLALLREMSVAVPPPELRAAFSSAVAPIGRLVEHHARHTAQLSRTRDLLLVPLITGRLDISDVDLGDLHPGEAA